MAKPKQKWTSEEEESLAAGVKKYGEGKWKTILNDSVFASSLANRSNVDLKDKWRNLSGTDCGSSSRVNARTSWRQVISDLLKTRPDPCRSSLHKRRAPTYKAMIYETLSSIKDPNGTDVSTMVKFLEPKYVLPKNFRRLLTLNLRKLVLNGDLEKVNRRYKRRNLSESDHGFSNRGNARTSWRKVRSNLLITRPEPCRSSLDKRRAPLYKAMIYESLSSIGDPNGTDVKTMINFLEPKYALPKSFRRLLTLNLRKLVLNGDLEKVNNRYKVKRTSSGAESQQVDVWTNNVDNRNEEQAGQQNRNKSQVGPQNCNEEQVRPRNRYEALPTETLEDAASVAAYKVALAETKEYMVIKDCEEKDRLAELLDESMAMLMLAKDLYEQCKKDGHIILSA